MGSIQKDTKSADTEASTVECLHDAEITPTDHVQLQALIDYYLSEVQVENPKLEMMPMPLGCKPIEGFIERFICLKVKGVIVAFVGYSFESNIVNETRLYVDRAWRGKGYATLLLRELVRIVLKRSSRAILFYNLTKGGEAALRRFEETERASSERRLRFFYEKNVASIVLEDITGSCNFDDHHKMLPCFFPYQQDLFVLDAKDNYIFTNYGKLLDLNSGYWCCPFGYRHPELDKSFTEGYFSHIFGYLHPYAVELAKRLCELSGMNRVGFNTSGSSVVDSAIRLAWQYASICHPEDRDRKIVVSLRGGFYGSSTTGLEVTGLKVGDHEYKYYLPDHGVDRKIDPFTPSANPLEELIEGESLQGRVAAFIFEPVLGVRGAFALEAEKLKRMIATCNKYDIVTIADEISTGMGRTGEMFACNHFGVKPDILCLGKPLTNGMFPLAAFLFNARVNSIFAPESRKNEGEFLYGSTLGGHPTGCMIALKVMDLLAEVETMKRVRELSAMFQQRLSELKSRYTIIRSVHGIGLMMGIEFIKSSFADRVQLGLRKRFVNCIPEGRFLMLMPPYTITLDEVAYALATLENVLIELDESNEG